ncbi:hypothetical protein Q5752_006534 [Cryptotrichosporon argae]
MMVPRTRAEIREASIRRAAADAFLTTQGGMGGMGMGGMGMMNPYMMGGMGMMNPMMMGMGGMGYGMLGGGLGSGAYGTSSHTGPTFLASAAVLAVLLATLLLLHAHLVFSLALYAAGMGSKKRLTAETWTRRSGESPGRIELGDGDT